MPFCRFRVGVWFHFKCSLVSCLSWFRYRSRFGLQLFTLHPSVESSFLLSRRPCFHDHSDITALCNDRQEQSNDWFSTACCSLFPTSRQLLSHATELSTAFSLYNLSIIDHTSWKVVQTAEQHDVPCTQSTRPAGGWKDKSIQKKSRKAQRLNNKQISLNLRSIATSWLQSKQFPNLAESRRQRHISYTRAGRAMVHLEESKGR